MTMLLPEIDELTRPFWDGTLIGELRVQACGECGRLRFPPRPMCPSCRSMASLWRAVSGRGSVWSFVVPHPPLLSGYSELAPYNVVVVALEEDSTIRMVGNLVAGEDAAINSVDPATIEIGSPVRVVFQRVSDEVALPRWIRAEAL